MQSDHFPDDDPMLPRTRRCTHDVISPGDVRYVPENMEVRRCLRCGEFALLDTVEEPLLFWRALVFVLAAMAVAGVAGCIGYAIWGRA